MIWLPAIVVSAVATELFAHLPIERTATSSIANGARAGRVILSPAISDHWKEKVMPAYAARMGRETVTLTLCFAALTAIVAALIALIGRIDPEAARFIGSAMGMAFSALMSTLYYLGRRRLVGA